LIRKKIPTPPPMAIEINLPALRPIFSAFMIFSITVCVLSQRFTAGDLSLRFIDTPHSKPPPREGVFYFCYMCGGLEALEGMCLQGFKNFVRYRFR